MIAVYLILDCEQAQLSCVEKRDDERCFRGLDRAWWVHPSMPAEQINQLLHALIPIAASALDGFWITQCTGIAEGRFTLQGVQELVRMAEMIATHNAERPAKQGTKGMIRFDAKIDRLLTKDK